MSASSEARRLVRVVEGIADRDVAVGFLRHELARVGADEGAQWLAEIDARAVARDDASARVLLLAGIALAGRDCEELRREIADVLEARGERGLAARLAPGASPREGGDAAAQVPDFGRGRVLTLGERKSLARRRDRQLLARVLRDPHPDVIRILLANPSLTEPDVVRLCARRPILAEVLREVARSTKWMVRYGVRLAIARNPYTPLDLALSLVPHLNAQDARELADSTELSDALRAACAEAAQPRTIH